MHALMPRARRVAANALGASEGRVGITDTDHIDVHLDDWTYGPSRTHFKTFAFRLSRRLVDT